jgi:hypothetical protein
VLVLRRVFDKWQTNTLRKTKLDVKSPLIKKIIGDVVPKLQGAMETEKASFEWPDDDIFRYVCVILNPTDRC